MMMKIGQNKKKEIKKKISAINAMSLQNLLHIRFYSDSYISHTFLNVGKLFDHRKKKYNELR